MAQTVKGKESACNVRHLGSTPGLGRSPGGGHGNPWHSDILAWRIPMDRGAWWGTVHGVAKSRTRLSNFTSHIGYYINMKSATSDK